jgi:hypothetical protein
MGGPGSGGRRTRSGRTPDPQALTRQRDGKDWTRLPKVGRLAPAPEWPIEIGEPTPNELLLWRRLWTTPQAMIWEADQADDVVVLYVRTFLEAMKPRGSTIARNLAKQLAAELFLTPASLFSGRYVIQESPEETALNAAVLGSTGTETPSARDRGGLTVVPFTPPVAGQGDTDDDDDDDEDDEPTDAGEPPF